MKAFQARMPRFAVLAALLVCCGAAASDAPSAAQWQLLARTGALADGVRTYTANVQADIEMHSFPYLHPQLTGKYYHEAPDRNKIVFTGGVPFIAKAFSKVYPEVPSPSQWASLYAITVEGLQGGTTVFKLVPKIHGRIDNIEASVDDRTAELVGLRWNYTDGGYAELRQTYGIVDGHLLVVRQSGAVNIPNWSADVRSAFSNFRLNVPIAPSVFTQG